ncbi:MAG: hypothetical protein KDA88_24115 [Planctomycetaceae bacterium]|nr:hypothetical protein [Planctomycetaceae bacterium]MCB9952144.1 hypothetical protein [Planctomycetaceae bacterium]
MHVPFPKTAISDHCHEFCLSEVASPRETNLLNWLHARPSSTEQLVRWLRGQEISVHRGESPAVAIIGALPSVSSPYESIVRLALVQRIAQLVQELSDCQQTRDLFQDDTWRELFTLIDYLADKESISLPLANLLSAIGEQEEVPFGEDEIYFFTRLIAKYQTNNDLKDQWVLLIEEAANPTTDKPGTVLKASLFDAFRGLLSMPNKILHGTFEGCLNHSCRILEHAFDLDSQKLNSIEDLYSMIGNEYPRYSNNARLTIAKLWGEFDWLPVPHPMEFAISVTRDQDILFNIQNWLAGIDKSRADLALFMKAIVDSETLPRSFHQYTSSTNSEKLMASGQVYTRDNFDRLTKSRSVEITSDEIELYLKQWIYAAPCVDSTQQLAMSLLLTGDARVPWTFANKKLEDVESVVSHFNSVVMHMPATVPVHSSLDTYARRLRSIASRRLQIPAWFSTS